MTQTTLNIGEDQLIRSPHRPVPFRPATVWGMLIRQLELGHIITTQAGLAVQVPEGRVLISRDTLGYLTSRFAPTSWGR